MTLLKEHGHKFKAIKMDGSKMKDYKEQQGLIEYIEKQSRCLDEQEISISPVKMATATNQYISCIKFSGIPILPPVMTAKRKDEMMSYKYQAQIAENKIKSRQRDKLMARAHRAVKTIQTTEPKKQHNDGEEKNKNLTAELERVQSLAETGQFEEAIQSIDSLSSGLMSLEDGSLPNDFYGLPCTSVHEQQISQVLQKLSKQLNLKDTLSSTAGSTLGSDGNVDTLTEQKNNLKIPDAVSEGSSNSFRDSQDTIVEVLNTSRKSKPPAIKIEDKPESSVKDSPSCGYGSGDSSAVSSANTSASERIKGSPKSLKNTVHFSEFVKVLKTNQSVEDEITVKRLKEMNSNSESTDKKSPELKGPQSLLSKVNLSPENEATTPSPDSILEVPFQPKADPPRKTNESLPSKNTLQKVLEDKPPKPGYVSPKISPSCGSDPGSRSSKSSTPVRRAASLKFNKPRKSDTCENSHSSSLHSSPHSQTSSSDNMSSQTDTNSRLSSTGLSQSTGRSSQTADTQNSSQQTQSQNDTQSTSQLSTTNSFSTRTSRTTNEQLTSVTDSQISARTDFTLETTDSESTIKAGVGHVGSSTGSSNLLRYKKAIENTLDNSDTGTDVSKSQLESVTESADCEVLQNNLPADAKGKGHVRRGSYTLDNPSPVLIHAQSRIDKEGGGTLGVETSIYAPVIGNPGINKPIQRKLDYDEDPDLENTRPVSLPIPPDQESEGKEEHIHRYLNHVQQQNKQPLKQQAPVLTSQSELSEYSTLNSINILHSLIEEINNKPDMSEEELLKLQKERFQAMHQGLLEKQRNDLEELFVMQRRQQINLQSEIDCHKKVVEKPHPGRKSVPFYSSPDPYCDGRDNRNISLQSHSSVLYPTRSNRPRDKLTPKNLMFPKTSTPTPKVYKPLVRSPVKSVNPVYRPNYPVKLPPDINDIETQLKFFKVTALARGFLTRRLLKSEKVQELIKTIRDTREFAFSFQSETPIKSGSFSNQDRNLLERIIAQLQAALLDVHEIFFVLPVSDRMELIRQTRLKEQERRYLGASSNSTIKDSARKLNRFFSCLNQHDLSSLISGREEELQAAHRPKTAPPSTSSPRSHSTNSRALKPLQSQISPIRKDDISQPNNRTNNKVRPKTAPEKPTREQLASKNRKVNNAAPTTNKPNKTPASNNKSVTKVIRKVSSKSDKSWR
ncbi:hypothetical protein LOTGIDRAFT_157573 [Lottia gigantea]|uniref:Centriolar coiled-coil protein of 110 kDa n=1 Tax=Lottia gigantea TaxID=225164 RepID=V4AVM5_LOTGI|nr:hypothetical protein LOTGIDRAFT_157573 [Lottia gigantea]ESP01393.1 hypothetical protein LOTGIDRAFT_157573 [Lottia gigantea]